MTALIRPRRFTGLVRVPASKSHTIRRLLIAALAEGLSEIEHPLDSLDTRSCLSLCRALGAEITEEPWRWIIRGIGPGGKLDESKAGGLRRCNVGNSGTTLFLGLAAAALGTEPVEFDGDAQIRCRSAGPLLDALAGLGISVNFAPNGCAPITVCGPWKGGRVSMACATSQYLSGLLLAAPLAPADLVTEIDVPLLNERPYVEMTLSYLDSQGIAYEAAPDFSFFRIPGGSSWKPMSGPVPGDFSSAAFPAAAAAITGGPVTLLGLDPADSQGDKAFFGFLEKMGCRVRWEQVPGKQVCCKPVCLEWHLHVSRKGPLKAGEFDLNATPDLLPALAAVACFAQGDTVMANVAHARIKECDRIAAMAEELAKLGFKADERPDGLVIHGNGSRGSGGNLKADSQGDHRVAMALAAVALGCESPVEIAGAECAATSYPGFMELLGAEIFS